MLVVFAVVLVAGALAWLTVRHSFLTRAEEDGVRRAERKRVDHAQKLYSQLSEFRPLGEIDDVEVILSDHLHAKAASALGAERARSLLSEVAQFLRLRIAGESPAEYISWRRSQGYRWRTEEELRALGCVEAYEFRMPRSWSSAGSMEARFEEMWRSSRSFGGPVNAPRALCTARGSIGIIGGSIDNARPSSWRPFDRLIASATGDESPGLTSVQWLVGPRSREDLMSAHGPVEFATVCIVIEYSDGSRRPLALTYLWDPAGPRWMHDVVSERGGSMYDVAGIDY